MKLCFVCFSPCVVGNLWDVTDRDIDRFTEEFLQSWLNCDNGKKLNIDDSSDDLTNELNNNICVHLIKARLACKMSHLNGSAPVIYGLPVVFE